MTDNELRELARQYEVRILPGGEDGGYLARVPTFAGIFTSGDTPEEALANGYEAIECLLESRMKIGKPYPKPEQIPA